jgi:cysteine desulfurase
VLLPVRADGLADLDLLARTLDERATTLVSVMAANNEIGVVQPLAEIGALCRARGVLFHSDAAQAVGKVPIDVEAMKIDLLTSRLRSTGQGHRRALYAPAPPRAARAVVRRRRRAGHPLGYAAGAACVGSAWPRDAGTR